MRLVKYTTITVGVVVGLFVALVAFNYLFPPTYEAAASLPGTTSKVVVQLEPMHLYLAEYRRLLILRKNGAPDQRIEMFADTGGYSRTQLYRLPNGRFLVRGFFDAVIIDPEKHTLITETNNMLGHGTYLGAFDDTAGGQWQFFAAAQSPEQSLAAGGG